jgi:non-canonical (house-cleaning) NTP pyrophosphatase
MPPVMVADVLAGEELGHVVDRLSGDHNSKQKGGAIAFLTRGRVDRRALYAQGLAMALVPFLNGELFPGGGS